MRIVGERSGSEAMLNGRGEMSGDGPRRKGGSRWGEAESARKWREESDGAAVGAPAMTGSWPTWKKVPLLVRMLEGTLFPVEPSTTVDFAI